MTIKLIFRFIPFSFILLALGLAAAALTGAQVFWEVQKARALDRGTPALVDLAEVRRPRGFPFFGEVNVRATLSADKIYLYWDEWEDGSVTQYPIVFLFSGNDDGSLRYAAAAVA